MFSLVRANAGLSAFEMLSSSYAGTEKWFCCTAHGGFALCMDFVQALPEGRNVITAPTIAAAQPPNNSHKVLFVGAPVKIREMLEPAESDALIP
jgi:hypothetical protein